MKKTFALLATALCLGFAATAAPLKIYTEENKPLNFSHGGSVGGMATEVVRAIQERVGDSSPITLGEWATGYDEALKQPNAMIYSAVRTPQRDKQFKWVGPISELRTFFYGKPGGITLSSLEDAKKVAKIGVPKKFYAEDWLLKAGFTNLVSSDTPADMIEQFKKGEIQLFVSHNLAISNLLMDTKVPVQSVKPILAFMDVKQHWMAFNLKTPDDIIQKWQKALDDLKKDGSFQKIWVKYNLSPAEMPK
jgi:polar amino acid transport system substrate-binding protein